ncbi:MAG TPA: hypothetical protein ENK36_04230, partial [Desulfobacterales bacterium]|nr:hypothetical protein [Desulfobacterales bacterium]
MNSNFNGRSLGRYNGRNKNRRFAALLPVVVCLSFLLFFSNVTADTLSLDMTQAIHLALENN